MALFLRLVCLPFDDMMMLLQNGSKTTSILTLYITNRTSIVKIDLFLDLHFEIDLFYDPFCNEVVSFKREMGNYFAILYRNACKLFKRDIRYFCDQEFIWHNACQNTKKLKQTFALISSF